MKTSGSEERMPVLDRLVHSACRIEMKAESMRKEQAPLTTE
jgi:hypothetical protein